MLAQWSRLKETVASWVPSGASWQLLLAVFLLGLLAGAGLTMLAHPHAWCSAACAIKPDGLRVQTKP